MIKYHHKSEQLKTISNYTQVFPIDKIIIKKRKLYFYSGKEFRNIFWIHKNPASDIRGWVVAGIEVLHRKQSAVAGVSATLPSNFTRPLNNHLFHLLPPSFLQWPHQCPPLWTPQGVSTVHHTATTLPHPLPLYTGASLEHFQTARLSNQDFRYLDIQKLGARNS